MMRLFSLPLSKEPYINFLFSEFPGEWDSNIRIEPPEVIPSQEGLVGKTVFCLSASLYVRLKPLSLLLERKKAPEKKCSDNCKKDKKRNEIDPMELLEKVGTVVECFEE